MWKKGGRERVSLGSRLARKHLPEEDVASSTEPGRIDYPVSHLNTCSLPFTVLSRVCVRTHFARASCTGTYVHFPVPLTVRTNFSNNFSFPRVYQQRDVYKRNN